MTRSLNFYDEQQMKTNLKQVMGLEEAPILSIRKQRMVGVSVGQKMDVLRPLIEFMSGIAHDPRIGNTHIALFVAVYNLWLENEEPPDMALRPKTVMKKAKILARSTYVRAIRDLHEWGYLVYKPSYNNRRVSRIKL